MILWINDIARNGVMNMAIDEMLFNRYKDESILRTYYWTNSCTTIGYFQKAKNVSSNMIVRRFTGGLTVSHHNDMSYSFVTSSVFWNIYNHHMTYRSIHLAIQTSLQKLGITSNVLDKKIGKINDVCIQTLCENDLISNGVKIVGSCLRKRRNKLIVQGSIHVNFNNDDRKVLSSNFAENMAKLIKTKIMVYSLSNKDIESANKIAKEKYSNLHWNNKF
jgi:lipoate-protein ligase A